MVDKSPDIKYELVNGYETKILPDDEAEKIVKQVGYTRWHFPLTAIVGLICDKYGCEGCRAFGISKNVSDILCRDYLYALNAPMETHLWHLK